MKLFLTRRLVPACVMGAAAVIALAAPGAASAAFPGVQCSGASIEGSGSSLQTPANEEIWEPAFEKGTNAHACAGQPGQGTEEKPTVAYKKTSSGEGEETWGLRGHAREYNTKAFVGTDQPPNAAQEKELLDGSAGPLLTIPILQAAVAVDIHLPSGCTGTSTSAPGQIALTDAQLEAVFQGTTKEWKALPGVSCTPASQGELSIKRVVRSDGSGTTAIFMKFLGQTDKKKLKFGSAKKTWTAEGEESLNTTWPVGTEIIQNTETESGGKLAEYVAKNAGTIGYSSVADAAGKESLPGLSGHTDVGPGTETFWAVIQNGGGGKGKHKTPLTYADPATGGDTGPTKSEANCENTDYINASGVKFPPASTADAWNSVTTSVAEEHYAICGFTYILADKDSAGLTGFTEPETQTVYDYLHFVLSTETGTPTSAGGQTLLNEDHDFLALPQGKVAGENVLKIAQEGANEIGF
jgi:ABC-type phosphate transport system substrate-binding protein